MCRLLLETTGNGERSRIDLPFCNVSVDVWGLTFATRPSTTVLGGFCNVTVTEIPIRPDAILADLTGRFSDTNHLGQWGSWMSEWDAHQTVSAVFKLERHFACCPCQA